jgi:hypothetical protein
MVRDVKPFGQVDHLPPWLDGPVIKALAKRNGWSYEQAQQALEAYGACPTHLPKAKEIEDAEAD